MLRSLPFLALMVAVLIAGGANSSLAQDYGSTGSVRSLTPAADVPAGYGEGGACLSAAEGRRAIQSSSAISLADAAKVAHGAASGDVVDYKICQAPSGYSYVLTILARNGKVARAWIDAASGKLIAVR
jgi:hypothetical protein